MDSSLRRVIVAIVVASVLGFVASGVELLAQTPRAYSGALFWMSAPQTERPGNVWTAPPQRAWTTGGSSGSSFPNRVWQRPLNNLPWNDSCHRRVAALETDAVEGPYGMQTVQYIGDWWRGLVYEPHAAGIGTDTATDFGTFAFGTRADRLAVGTSGLPQSFVGNPGACVARALAGLQGEYGSDGMWHPHAKDIPTGSDCLATSYYMVLRANTELRCEPYLGDQGDTEFTARFQQLFPGQGMPVDYGSAQ